jgi:ABC-type glycerol-3-phosphate transport system permease component
MTTKTNLIRKIILFCVLLLLVIVINIPIIYMISNSFKSLTEISTSISIFPKHFTFDNYIHLFTNTKIPLYLANSLIITAISTAITVIVAACAGYILSRYTNHFTKIYGRFLLILQIFPIIISIIPLFILFTRFHLMNTKLAMIIVYIAIGLPYSVWMFRAYFEAVPKAMEEAAWIDGSSRAHTFFSIVLPISGPGISAVTSFVFVMSWNEYMVASTFLKSMSSYTITVGIQMFVNDFNAQWGYMMASTTIAMIPTLILFIYLQKYLISGYTAGSTKG